MKTVAIVQARTGSSRLPGKVLEQIEGRSMLWRVCRRAGRSVLIDRLVVATTTRPRDQAIVDECRRLGVPCFRGSETDVLERYHQAAELHAADVVVRITADCPLIDPEVIDLVAGAFFERQPDYASNALQRSWPQGLDTEVMTAAALARAAREATQPHQREHVTPYIYQHPELFTLHPVTSGRNLAEYRWTVDTPEDLQFVRAVYRRFPGDDAFCWRDVLDLLAKEPALADLNRHVRQKDLAEG